MSLPKRSQINSISRQRYYYSSITRDVIEKLKSARKFVLGACDMQMADAENLPGKFKIFIRVRH
jgi:hypothetical protein